MKRALTLILLSELLLAGCATDPAFLEGKQLLAEGRVEEGLEQLDRAARASPGNAEFRSYYIDQRERTVNQILASAETARINARFDEAEALYLRARRIDPENRQALAGLSGLETNRRHAALIVDARTLIEGGESGKASPLLRRVLAEHPRHREARQLMRRVDEEQSRDALDGGPRLRALLARPITLEFRDANLRAVFEVISRSAGINFVFDKDVRPDLKTTLFVRDSRIEDAIDLLLITNQLDRKVISDNTLLVYPSTPAKQKDYKELVVRSFYLANADVKQTATMLRAMLKMRDVFVDDRINMVVIRDTPEVIRLAEKLITAQDVAEPEALLEVEVLEISRSRLESLGLQWPTQIGYGQLTQGASTQTGTVVNPTTGAITPIVTPGVGATVANGVIDLRQDPLGLTTFIANPALMLNIKAQDADANVLANPRIRVKNGEKAKVHIGDKLPVFTSTATSTGFVSQSITYLDVGVKLDVEPSISMDDEVTITVGLEVSNIVRQITTSAGNVAYQVGTRAAGTTLRLRDGETQVLAGLIQDEDRRSANKIPILGDLPIAGRLFSSHDTTNSKTEIVLLITPHIVRNLELPEAGSIEFLSGSESGAGQMGPRDANAVPLGPIPGAEPPSQPEPQQTPSPSPQAAPATPQAPVFPAGPMREEGLAR